MQLGSSSAAAGSSQSLYCMSLLRFRASDEHGRAANQGIRRIADDLVGWFETRQNFDFLAIVAPNTQRNQLCVAVAHDRRTQAFLSKNQSIGWERDGLNCRGKGQMDKRIGTGQKPAGAVLDIDLDEESARGEVDGVRVSNQGAVERLAGKLIEGQVRR